MTDSLRRTLRRRRTRWLLLAAAVVLVFVGAVAVEILRIRRDIDAGRELLSDIDLAKVEDDGGLAAVADRAADRVETADRRARRSPLLRVAAVLPVFGGQVGALRDMTGAVAEIAGRGRDVAAAIEESLDAGSGPAGRLEVVRTARNELLGLARAVEQVHLGADGWLIPPLRDARRELAIELADARSDLARSSVLAQELEAFLVGPRRYLVLGGNNAEMRAVGIPTTSGIAEIAGGAIDVGRFSGATDRIELPEPGVPVPIEYETVYGWLNGDRGYRTTLATANWPAAAQIAADITAVNQYGPVDGIIYVDTTTLAVLLNVIGPVEVEGRAYSFDNVLEELLYRNYLQYRTIEDNPERKALQSRIAQAIFEQIDQRDYSVLRLAGALSNLARGRHLLAWADDTEQNRLWQAFGADGALAPDGLLVVSQDLGASKLDYFVRQAVEVTAERRGPQRRVELAVTLENPDHGETSEYIDGGSIYAEAGEYGSFLVAYLPRSASDIESDAGITHHGPDGPMYAVGTILRVPEGSTRTVTISFSLPVEEEVLEVMPSARLLGTRWTIGDEEIIDREPFDLDLTDVD